MKMHGLHAYEEQLTYLDNKPTNEIIVLLEEIFRAERLNKKIQELVHQSEKELVS